MLEVEIDFDEASRAWRANKRKKENGQFEYICGAIRSSGNPCTKLQSKCKNVQHAKQRMIDN